MWKGPFRSAAAFMCCRNTISKDLFQMRITVSSGIPSASATKPQPETGAPIGGTPTLRRTSMANRISTSRRSWPV